MIRSRFVRSSTLVLATFVALSCADYSPTAPIAAPTQAQDGLISGLLGLVTGTVNGVLGLVLKVIGFQSDPNGIDVRGVQWAPSHVSKVRTVSETIGYDGGSLEIPGSDFTITFPRGALRQSTAISITSDASGYVTYDMKPHGLTFYKPVIVTQRLQNTKVYGTSKALNSFCAYFDKDPNLLDGLLKAREIETTIIFGGSDGKAEVQTWQLNHFSRYMLASG
ncbi:MAG TPA: hypothetical protein VK544_02340 [Gemmatimonadaceae bacterium]|nr:hypothetical protein [Gemmatimonadaceae bacterium]